MNTAAKLKRYDISCGYPDDPGLTIEESDSGEWVKYHDAERLLNESLKRKIATTKQSKNMKSQNDRLAKWLMNGRSINPLQALNELGIFRLASRVNDLKKEPYHLDIITEKKTVFNRFGEKITVAEYKLPQHQLSTTMLII